MTCAAEGEAAVTSNRYPRSTSTPLVTAVYPNATYLVFTGGPAQSAIQWPPPFLGTSICPRRRLGCSCTGGGATKSEGCCGMNAGYMLGETTLNIPAPSISLRSVWLKALMKF